MASSFGRLWQSIVQLFGRGYTANKVIAKIKDNPSLKNSTNGAIQANIQRYKDGLQSAKIFGRSKAGDKLEDIVITQGRQTTGRVQVSFKFTFDFPAGSKSGKVGKQSVFMTIDVPADTSKSALQKLMRSKAYEEVISKYDFGDEEGVTIRIQVISITAF